MRPHNHIISPSHVLVLLACIGGAMALLMVVFPQKGISLGNYKLRFITWAALTDTSDVELLGDIDAFLAAQDTTAVDSVLADTIPTRPNLTLTSLQYQNNDASSLRLFFEKADAASAARQNVHVFHYGDSQIESDRISSFLREQLQSLFGGGGPGWLAPLPITSSMNINQKQSDNWLRYTAFGYDDGKLASKRFGALASCFRFTPATKEIPTDTTEAWIEFVPSAKSGSHCAGYDVVKIWLGYHRQPVQLEVWITDSLHYSETIEAGDFIQCKSYHTGFSPKKLKLVLRGTDSPDIHGIVLEKEGGITVDNVAMRGSDGLLFRKIPKTDLTAELQQSGTGLVLLQFGGNAMPYIKSKEGATNYGESFRNQIKYLKSILPDAAFIVIGPSDMSESVDGNWQTYTHLEDVRNALRDVALSEGCGFWDMYAVMGGKNSMISWVANNPQYAGDDHVHFTPAGAKKVAGLLYKAIEEEYEAWKQNKIEEIPAK